MTKEDKQIIDRAVKEEWRIGDRTRLKRLLEKNLKQYRDKVELENKIADIKANCDLAIEGRDIKIKELEKENAELKKEIEKHKWNDIFLEDCAGYDKKIAEEYTTLQEHIEKLEKENAELKGELELWESGGCRVTNLDKCGVVQDLKEQIEEMKRCEICKHFRWNCCSYEISITKDCIQNKMKHFELKEIKE